MTNLIYQCLTGVCIIGILYISIVLTQVIRVTSIYKEPGFIIMLLFLMLALFADIVYF